MAQGEHEEQTHVDFYNITKNSNVCGHTHPSEQSISIAMAWTNEHAKNVVRRKPAYLIWKWCILLHCQSEVRLWLKQK